MYFKPHRMHNIQIFSYFYSKQIIFRLLPKERRVERPGFSCIFMQHDHTIPRHPHTVCHDHTSNTFIKHVLHIFLQIVIYSKLFA